ncbi:MAG: glycosyltransferase family 2 protein [Bacteroidota bacterium]
MGNNYNTDVKESLVSVISINYNQSAVTLEMLESLEKLQYKNIEIIIVDNASPKDNPDILKQKYPNIKLIKSKKNLGFAGGNNLGIQQAKGKYLLFLNNDTEVEPDTVSEMVYAMESDQKTGLVTPKILFYHSKERKLIQSGGTNKINILTARSSNKSYKTIDKGQYDFVYETSYPHGAAMMTSAKVIEEAGLMPDLYFLYYEELDWAHMIKRAGYKILYCGTAAVYHKESVSIGKTNPMKIYYMNRNRLIFLRRNAGLLKVTVGLIFYSFISLPKNTIAFLIRKNFIFIKNLWRAYFWNLTHFNIRKTPYLTKEKQIEYFRIKKQG